MYSEDFTYDLDYYNGEDRSKPVKESQNKKKPKEMNLKDILADVSYLMAVEKSKSSPATQASKKILLSDALWVFYNNFSWEKYTIFIF